MEHRELHIVSNDTAVIGCVESFLDRLQNLLVYRSLLLPTDLCQFVLMNKLAKPFQLFVLLKACCSGKFKITEKEIEDIRVILGLESTRTVANNLKVLQKRNWIGYNKKSGYYFIRSFAAVKSIEKLKFKTAAEFTTNLIRDFKAFLVGAVIGNIIRFKIWQIRELEQINGCSKHSSNLRFRYYKMANTYLSKILNVSISTAYEYKQLARDAKFILIEPTIRRIWANKCKFALADQATKIRKCYREIEHKIRIFPHGVFEQMEDRVLACISLKRKKYSLKNMN